MPIWPPTNSNFCCSRIPNNNPPPDLVQTVANSEKKLPLLFRIVEETVKKTIPHSVIFEVTRRCNLDCVMCYVVGHDSAHPDELSLQEIKGILAQLA